MGRSRTGSMTGFSAALMLASSMPASPTAAEPNRQVDLALVSAIKDEGLSRSRVMDYARRLNDDVGARLTGSPQYDRAADWAVSELRKIGASARVEAAGPFGLAWEHLGTSLDLVGSSSATYVVQATPWSPGTAGPVVAPVILVPQLTGRAAFASWRGRLRGRVVLYGLPPVDDPDLVPGIVPMTPERLARYEQRELEQSSNRDANISWLRQAMFDLEVARFMAEEGAVAILRTNGSGKTFTVDNGTMMGFDVYRPDRRQPLPSAVMEADGYARIARLASAPEPPKVRLDIRVRSDPGPSIVKNVVGDLPGRSGDGEIVMLGAHLDSWTAGTGATDDGAAVAIQLEALRILRKVGYRPRRPIRIAFWGGEEQGLLGSRAYVEAKLAAATSRSGPADLPVEWQRVTAFKPLAAYRSVSAYFNMDAGGGRILGLATGGNDGAAAVFRRWFEAVADLGVSVVSPRTPEGVDLLSFKEVGIPAFSIVQDLRDYDTRTHHTDLDTYARLSEPDMKQAATALAVLLYQACEDDRPLPRAAPIVSVAP